MNQTILMGKEQVLTLTVTGDVSAETLSFVVSESFGGSAVVTKSGASIDADYKSPYTFVKVTILQADTAGLYAGHKFYSLSGNNGILLQGSVYFQAVASNPYDPTLGYDLRTVRVLAIPASDYNTGDFLQVQEVDGEKAFVNLTATEMRTALDVAKVQAGTATDLYLKWNNSTSRWENRTLAEIQGDLGIGGLSLLSTTPITVPAGQTALLSEIETSATMPVIAYITFYDTADRNGFCIVYAFGDDYINKIYYGSDSYSANNIVVGASSISFVNDPNIETVIATCKVHTGYIPL